MKKIKYIIRKRAMGDVLWIEPVIKALANKYDKLIVHTKFNVLFENYPLANVHFRNKLNFFEKSLYHLERLAGTGFLTLNLDDAYEKEPGNHFLHAYQKKAGVPLSSEYPALYLSEQEKESKMVDSKYIVLHIETFSEKNFRSVHNVDWNAIVSWFKNLGYEVVQLSLTNDVLPGTTRKKTGIREMISLIYNASFFVGIDSGPSHLAASLRKPSLVIFGSINPNLRHFENLFNGVILKQPCDPRCTTFDVAHATDHFCNALTSGNIPRCCVYQTETVIDALLHLLEKNATKNYQ